MYSYSIIQWMFFFYLYCFGGWCVESAYVSVMHRKLTNRGFLRGPFLPLYGSGAVMMLVVSMPFQDNIVMVFAAGCVGATVLEYVTGVLMEALFKVRYWDYSEYPLNFQGRVCLGTTLAWGLLTVLLTRMLHVPVEKAVLAVPDGILTGVTLGVTVLFFADFALSFKAAADLREILKRMEQARREMVHIRSRLDTIVSVAGQGLQKSRSALTESMGTVREELAEGAAQRWVEVKAGIESRLESIKNLAQTRPSEYLESVKEEIFELKTRYAVNLEVRKRLGALKDFFQRDLIRSNPGMTSEEYEEALEELKGRLSGEVREREQEEE